MELGVYTLVTPDYGIDEAADLVAEIGYAGIEWTVDYAKAVWDGESNWHIDTTNLAATTAAVREAAERNGLKTLGICPRLKCHEKDRVRQCIDIAKSIGATALRVMAPTYDGTEHVDGLMEQARCDYTEAGEWGREAGVKIWVEIHDRLIVPSASATRRLLEGLDSEWIGAIYDPGNMIREGMENWKMCVELLGPYLHHVHVKNTEWRRSEEGKWAAANVSLAEGQVDWPMVVGALKDAGYDGYLSIEDFRGGYACKPVGITTREKLQEDYDYLMALI